jgi:hypothetical protein
VEEPGAGGGTGGGAHDRGRDADDPPVHVQFYRLSEEGLQTEVDRTHESGKVRLPVASHRKESGCQAAPADAVGQRVLVGADLRLCGCPGEPRPARGEGPEERRGDVQEDEAERISGSLVCQFVEHDGMELIGRKFGSESLVAVDARAQDASDEDPMPERPAANLHIRDRGRPRHRAKSARGTGMLRKCRKHASQHCPDGQCDRGSSELQVMAGGEAGSAVAATPTANPNSASLRSVIVVRLIAQPREKCRIGVLDGCGELCQGNGTEPVDEALDLLLA